MDWRTRAELRAELYKWIREREKEAAQRYKARTQMKFEEITRPVLKFLCENYHPHVSVIITPTTAVLYEGELSIGEINDYVVD